MKVNVKGVDLNYEVMGSGTPILFVHGWSGNRNSLRKLAEFLSISNTCYLIDLPGRGESANPPSTWGAIEYGLMMEEFISKVIGSSTIYIGHSFGGTLGVLLSLDSKSVVSKLILMAPSYMREGVPILDAKESVDTFSGTKLLLSKFKGYLKRFKKLRRLYHRVVYPRSEMLKLAHLEENFKRVVSVDLRDRVKDIDVETLIVWGADDIDTPLYQAYFLNEKIKSSILKVYSSYGHELPVRFPEVILNDIKIFINK